MPNLHTPWRYDLIRQSTVVFTAVAAFTTLIILFAFVITIGSTPLNEVGGDPVQRTRTYAARYGIEQAQEDARLLAESDLPQLAATATYDDGYRLTYDTAWNDALTEAISLVPRQWYGEHPGTQWVELRR